jgi:hypothetical protein
MYHDAWTYTAHNRWMLNSSSLQNILYVIGVKVTTGIHWMWTNKLIAFIREMHCITKGIFKECLVFSRWYLSDIIDFQETVVTAIFWTRVSHRKWHAYTVGTHMSVKGFVIWELTTMSKDINTFANKKYCTQKHTHTHTHTHTLNKTKPVHILHMWNELEYLKNFNQHRVQEKNCNISYIWESL